MTPWTYSTRLAHNIASVLPVEDSDLSTTVMAGYLGCWYCPLLGKSSYTPGGGLVSTVQNNGQGK